MIILSIACTAGAVLVRPNWPGKGWWALLVGNFGLFHGLAHGVELKGLHHGQLVGLGMLSSAVAIIYFGYKVGKKALEHQSSLLIKSVRAFAGLTFCFAPWSFLQLHPIF